MIINDLQRLRWQILDEALRDPVMEYYMGDSAKNKETGNTRSLLRYVNARLKSFHRDYSCSKRMLQNDIDLFQKKGGRLQPRFRRGHKRILRYINPEWKNPLLKPARTLQSAPGEASSETMLVGPLTTGTPTPVTMRITGETEGLMQLLGTPPILQRQTDVKSGTTTLTLEVTLCPALQALLLGMADTVEVLAPESLRDAYRKTSSTVQRLYGQPIIPSKPKKEEQLSLFDELF